ncbi:hypothetical protein GWK47_028524 [Chionoecetes opilio]|uniref:Uncharacterized protein n=1 Tax=Chionoecetes opilio TaxID=41210 RepID=A0A8J4YYM3_CHIOP|nr:hypothetical protein GWK47_028524 [Chionoecetes opilio]
MRASRLTAVPSLPLGLDCQPLESVSAPHPLYTVPPHQCPQDVTVKGVTVTWMYRNAYAGAKKYKAGISPPVRRVSRQATGGSRGDVVTVSHLRHWSPCRARQGVGT